MTKAIKKTNITKAKTVKRVANTKAKAPRKNAKKAEVVELKPRTGNVINMDWKKKAKLGGGGNGDALDTALRNAWLGYDTPEQAYVEICKENDIDPKRWWNTSAGAIMNHGMRRMNLGNVLRARIGKKIKVTVRGKAITI